MPCEAIDVHPVVSAFTFNTEILAVLEVFIKQVI